MKPEKYDFSGWATKNNLLCSDGVTIAKDAFAHNDGKKIPLVWNHQHNDPERVIGHAVLENREEGVYAYCLLNNSVKAQHSKELISHGDVEALSIYANNLVRKNNKVSHGEIREVSLVLAGANPGALIDSVIRHGLEMEDELVIFSGESGVSIFHAEEPKNDKTSGDIFRGLSEEQKNVIYDLMASIIEEAENKEDNDEMKQNAFSKKQEGDDAIMHAEIAEAIKDGKRYGSLKESFIQHGITDIEFLFPEANNLTSQPIFIERDMSWVSEIMNGVHKSPFSRVRTIFADITKDEARAKGYIKGKEKTDEQFALLKRSTEPTTIYKKQSLHRDDIVDITDLGIVSFMNMEMKKMLDEEIGRAILVGDGRQASSDDKVNEQNIRPIWKDDDMYTIKTRIKTTTTTTSDERAKLFIRAARKARKGYKGIGKPTMYTTEDIVTDCLLMEDNMGRVIYDTEEKLATALRVKKIVTVEPMEGLERTDTTDSAILGLLAIIVNPSDYNIGMDKGGVVNYFDDFDIDYNKQKYLMETRMSGALTRPYSAIAIEEEIE